MDLNSYGFMTTFSLVSYLCMPTTHNKDAYYNTIKEAQGFTRGGSRGGYQGGNQPSSKRGSGSGQGTADRKGRYGR
jgi:hypothetical protein